MSYAPPGLNGRKIKREDALQKPQCSLVYSECNFGQLNFLKKISINTNENRRKIFR